jgi:DNA-directed RNA polymerase specialized sigma24 family protein
VAGRGPSPEEAAEVAEGYSRLLDLLGDDRLRRIANWKLEGYTNEEIAERVPCSVATVERKLRRIRRAWRRQQGAAGPAGRCGDG